MAETIRLNKVLRELNISIDRAVDFLESKGVEIEKSPNTKISEDVHVILSNEFQTDANKKVASKEVGEAKLKEKEVLREQREREIEEKHKESARKEEVIKATKTLSGPKQVGKIDLERKKPAVVTEVPKQEEPVQKASVVEEIQKVVEKTPPAEETVKPKVVEEVKEEVKAEVKTETLKEKKEAVAEPKKPVEAKKHITTSEGEVIPEEKVKTKYQVLSGPKIAGDKIDLSQFNKPKKKKEDKKPDAKSGDSAASANKKKRRRISKVGGPNQSTETRGGGANRPGNDRFKGKPGQARRPIVKEEPSDEDVKKQVRETLRKTSRKIFKRKRSKIQKR